ncbi:thermonuclease family protein [uncultured Desulfovibrio sp.]|uniref:thermonuclease family protein n=1 Tax=uncultured Desulfovibrio sp. TaxID=167968 RepID=UPI002056053C|nr:thermonuclease family protein [uncultured Desulfovibrio sp.]DAQ05240.1 MAG TPA: nuclease-like protein [Caudoviricetes sp.]
MRIVTLFMLCLFFAVPAWGWSGEVVSVHDGDTLKVRRTDNGKTVSVRVYGVDCPEIGQPYGKEARDMTARIALGKTVEIVPAQNRKSYKREVAGLVRLDALVILQDVLISTGLAWVDDRYCKLQVCDLWRMHQADAKAATPPRGLWADPDPAPPWQWRKMKRPKSRH